MSVSSKNSNLSSILRKTPSMKSKLIVDRKAAKVRFQLPHTTKVRNILQNFVNEENSKDYETLVCLIRDSELLDEDVQSLLSEATQCISILNQDLRLFIEAILKIRWINYSDKVIAEYQSFLINLLSAHNYHAKYAIDTLVSKFLPEPDKPDWPDGEPNEAEIFKCAHVHIVLNVLLEVVPMCRELLMHSMITQYPYFKKPTHFHELYIHNLLWILIYRPQFRQDILHLIFSKLVIFDVNAPKEDIERAENDCEMDDNIFVLDEDLSSTRITRETMKHPVAQSLDVCLNQIFNYFITECHDSQSREVDWEKTKSLYQDMITVFDKVLLPTYNTHHVQFAMFILCCFKTTIMEAFINYLWKKVCNPSVAAVLRQTAVAYIASFLARGSFIPLNTLKVSLMDMADWIHCYISTQDELECVNADVRIHTVFYSICQALFYVVAFRHRELVNTRKNITFLEGLNLGKIATSRLNPLRVCQPAVVQNFAAITRKYQVAYCYSVIEHNTRSLMETIYQDEKGATIVSSNILDTFFPFDPYFLKRSGKKIAPIYLEYQTLSEVDYEVKQCETDDFLSNDSPESSHRSDDRFSYGTSPGFKKKRKSKM